jgi:hypothetical protein
MEPENQLSEETWLKMKRLPYMVAIVMEGAEGSGVAGSARERQESLRSILDARDTFPGNRWIQAVVPKASKEEILQVARTQHDQVLDKMEEFGILSISALWERTISCIQEVFQALRREGPEESVEEFKTWLLTIASRVANSAKEGDFFGIGGQRFSPKEHHYYDELERTLESL